MRQPENEGYRSLKPIAIDEQARRQDSLLSSFYQAAPAASSSPRRRSSFSDLQQSLEQSSDRAAAEADTDHDKRQGAWQRIVSIVQRHNQGFFGAMITINMLVLWGETDRPSLEVWDWIDKGFMLLFIVEWILQIVCWKRLAEDGGRWKPFEVLYDMHCRDQECYWYCFDTFLVALGSFEMWIARPLLLGRAGATWFLQLLWLLRQLRIIRVFRMFKTLKVFSAALAEMMYDFTWIFLVMFIAFVVCGVPLTHLLGHGEALETPAEDDEEHNLAYKQTRENFRDVATTLFTLFKLTTTDNWDEISDPLLALDTRWRPFFVFFIAFASWTMLSVLTAIASDKIIDATSNRKELEQRERERRHKQFLLFLRDSFLDADADGNGYLDKEEFEALMRKEEVHTRMRQLGVRLSEEDIKRAWDMLDVEHNPTGLQIDEFVDGLKFLQEGLATKHVVTVDYSLKRIDKRFHNHIQLLAHRAAEVEKQKSFLLEQIPVADAKHLGRINAFCRRQGAEYANRASASVSSSSLRVGIDITASLPLQTF